MIGLRSLMTGKPSATDAAQWSARRFRLGESIVADPVRHTIIRNGRTIAVEPRVMQLLAYWAAHSGQVISKAELRERVWGTHVVDEAVHRAVSLLRSALGDSPRDSTVVETLPRHGYRLLIAPTSVDAAAGRPRTARALGWAAAAAGVFMVGLLISPGWNAGPAPAPAPHEAASASVPAPDVAAANRQRTPRIVAAAPEPPAVRSVEAPSAPAAAPEPSGYTSSTSGPPALAPTPPGLAAPAMGPKTPTALAPAAPQPRDSATAAVETPEQQHGR